MPRYAVDFIADIGVLKFNDYSGLSGNCKENSCQTDKVSNNNAYQTGMGNIQCLVSCTDQAQERKVLVSRGIQCGKSKISKRIRRQSSVISDKGKLSDTSKQSGDVSMLPARPCVSGVNLQTIKDGMRQENSMYPCHTNRSNTEAPYMKDNYLKRKRDMLLSKLQLIENGEEADVDSLSDTLSNLDVKAELQRHLSESYQQRMQDTQTINDVNIENIEDTESDMNRQINFTSGYQSHERGDVLFGNVGSNNYYGTNFGEPVVKQNQSTSKIPVQNKNNSVKPDRRLVQDRNGLTTGSGDKKVSRNEKQALYQNVRKQSSQVDERALMHMMEPQEEFTSTKSMKAIQNEYKNCAGDIGENQPIYERPPLHPFSRPQTPVNRSRYTEQRDHMTIENVGTVNQASPSQIYMNQGAPYGRSELPIQHKSPAMSTNRSGVFTGEHSSMIPENRSLSPTTDMLRHMNNEQPNENCSYGNRLPDNNMANSTPLGKSQFLRGKSVSQKFYVPESANIEKILRDQSDRRIKAICDRHHCDIEVYSRAPRSGFMKNVMILTAPSQEALKKCVRSLDCSFKWCISSQLK